MFYSHIVFSNAYMGIGKYSTLVSLAFYFHLLLPYLESICTLTDIMRLIPPLHYFSSTCVEYSGLNGISINRGVSCWTQDLPLILGAAF